MDTSRLYLLLPDPGDLLDFTLPPHRDRLVEMAAALRPELIILDSLSSISSKGENSVEDVRQVLSFLNLLAQDCQAGLLLIHHLRKGGSGQLKLWDLTMDDFRGSGHIIAMARSVMGLSVVQTQSSPDRNGPRKLEIIKTNLGPYPKPLGFDFVPLDRIPGGSGPGAAGVLLRWGDAPQPYQEPTQSDQCREWLASTLRDAPEPLHPAAVVELAEVEGFTRLQVYKARDALGQAVENTLGRKHPKNAWKWVGPVAP
jgi:hypothetical protein